MGEPQASGRGLVALEAEPPATRPRDDLGSVHLLASDPACGPLADAERARGRKAGCVPSPSVGTDTAGTPSGAGGLRWDAASDAGARSRAPFSAMPRRPGEGPWPALPMACASDQTSRIVHPKATSCYFWLLRIFFEY